MMTDTRIPANTPIGTADLRKMCGVKAKSLGQHLHNRQNWRKLQCIAYLNDGTLPTDAVPVKHEADVGLFDQVLEPETIVDDNDLGPEWFPEPVEESRGEIAPPLAKPALPARWRVTLFTGVKDNRPKLKTFSTEGLFELLTTHDERTDRDGPLFSGLFNGKRGNNGFESTPFICLDMEGGQPRIEDVLQLFPDTLLAYHTTHSHCWKSKYSKKAGTIEDRTYTPENPRFRVIILLSRPVNAADHARLVAGVKSVIPSDMLENSVDTSCFDRARIHFLPACIPEHKQYAFSGQQEGQPLDVDRFIELGDTALPPPPLPAKPALPEKPTRPAKPALPEKKSKYELWTPINMMETATPAWKALTASSILILIVCRTKAGRSAKAGIKDNSGRPIFEFTRAEALNDFGFNPVTFANSLNQLVDVGFIDRHRKGGIDKGQHISAQFRLAERWKHYQPPPRDATKKYNTWKKAS